MNKIISDHEEGKYKPEEDGKSPEDGFTMAKPVETDADAVLFSEEDRKILENKDYSDFSEEDRKLLEQKDIEIDKHQKTHDVLQEEISRLKKKHEDTEEANSIMAKDNIRLWETNKHLKRQYEKRMSQNDNYNLKDGSCDFCYIPYDSIMLHDCDRKGCTNTTCHRCRCVCGKHCPDHEGICEIQGQDTTITNTSENQEEPQEINLGKPNKQPIDHSELDRDTNNKQYNDQINKKAKQEIIWK